MLTQFQQGFASGFITGAAFVLTVLVLLNLLASRPGKPRWNRRMTDASKFRRTSYMALSQCNDSEDLDKAFGVKK